MLGCGLLRWGLWDCSRSLTRCTQGRRARAGVASAAGLVVDFSRDHARVVHRCAGWAVRLLREVWKSVVSRR
eukprot:6964493-Alexandrium_andersonii.AAC.1